jgi:hypothetical protein
VEDYKAFFDLISKGEWSVLKDHFPQCFLIFLVGIGLTFLFYQNRITALKEQIESYQTRLGEVPQETTYTKLTNRDLKWEASKMGDALRTLDRELMQERMDLDRTYETQREVKQPNEQKEVLYQQHEQAIALNRLNSHEHFQKFVGPARALCAAIRDRLPKNNKLYDDLYTEITLNTGTLYGVMPIGEVANAIEKYASLLPIPMRDWFSLRWQDGLFTIAVLTGVVFWALRQGALYCKERTLPPIR